MSDASSDPDVTELLADLTRELRRLEREVESDRGRERSLRRDLGRLTSEVAIPGLILLLKANIQALELLRRAIRIAEGREVHRDDSEMRERAERLGQATLARLDDVLGEVQTAVEGRADDDRAQQLVEDAREIRSQIAEELDANPGEESGRGDESEPVDIDIDAELRSLKDDLEDGNDSGPQSGGLGSGPEDSGTEPDSDGSDTDDRA